ncbi:MAG TPA: hypothetical protein VL574_00885, partial [Stellaceae bacterium]|nr:hypothetical protein [Stellaceae bacterium]
NSEHNAIVAIASGGSQGTDVPWNANGTEPSTLQNLRTNGWAKLVQKTTTDGKPSGGVYVLTAVGKAIYARTGGGTVGSNGSGSSDGVSDQTKQAITAAVASVQSLLAGLGGSGSGISTGTTGQNASNILTGSSSPTGSNVNITA